MTTSHDPDRRIHAFLAEGDETLDDQVYDAVRSAIEDTPQRAGSGPWRTPFMNKIISVGLAAAAVVVAILVGAQLFGTPTGGFGGAPDPTATAEPSPTPESSAAEPTSSAEAFLPEGPYRVQDVGELPDAPRITVMIPSAGWTSIPAFGGLIKGPDEDPPQSAMLLWAWPAGTTFQVWGDPCNWATSERTDASTVDEIATALATQPTRDGSDPVDVTIGGHSGKHVTLRVPDDIDGSFSDCDQGDFTSYAFDGGEPARTHQGPGQIDEFWILDVDGAIVILDAMYRPDTPSELIQELRDIAESATFELP